MPTERSNRAAAEPVHVLVKAMAVLDLLAQEQEELTLREIAQRLDLNKSTCHRILSTLVSGDFVERPAPGAYRLGIGAFRIGSAMERRMGVRERALPAMRDLFRATGETVFLLVPRGDEAICLERLDGRYASAHVLVVGGALPLHLGAGPRILLASRPEEQVEAYIEGPFRRWVTPSPVSADQLRDQVEHIREVGYATSEDDVEVGVRAISTAICDRSGSVVAALSISGLTVHLPDSELEHNIELLRQAAADASRSLGHRQS